MSTSIAAPPPHNGNGSPIPPVPQTAGQIAQQHSDAEWGWVPAALVFVILGVACIIFAGVGLKYIKEDGIIIGAVISWVNLGIGYWWGTSRSSEKNGAAVRQIATSPMPATLATTVSDTGVTTDLKTAGG